LAKVTFNKSAFQETFSKNFTGRFLLDFSAAGATKKTPLNQAFLKSIGKITDKLAQQTAENLQDQTRKFYNEGISEVQAFLKTGIEGVSQANTIGAPKALRVSSGTIDVSEWKSLSPGYFKRKPLKTRRFFWKRRSTGGLSASFGYFAGAHKSAVTRTTTVVVLNDKRPSVAGGTVYRYDLTFTLPKPHQGQAYFTKLFQKSFLLGKPYEGAGFGLKGGLVTLGYLEGSRKGSSSQVHRPFIAKVMAKKGNALKARIDQIIRTQVI